MSPAEVRSAPVRSNQGVQSLVIVAVSADRSVCQILR